jgi:hypothetical protein
MKAIEIAEQACFFRIKRKEKWHRIINHFVRSQVHLSYCGLLQNFNLDKAEYSGEWNAAEYRGIWVECDTCERLFTDD